MKIFNIGKTLRSAVMLSAVFLISTSAVVADDSLQGPVLPPSCSMIEVPQGYSLVARSYAVGVQIYRWNGSQWSFVAPSATLYADADLDNLIGTHFAGPTWLSNGGSSVVAARVDGCTPDAGSIPWLLLRATATDGEGLFSKVRYIQRVNTAGGNAPSTPGRANGMVVRVPYTTEYYFYQQDTIGLTDR